MGRNKKVRIKAMGNGKIDKIIDKYQGNPSSVIQALLEIQCENHWLPREVLEKISEKLGIPLNQIQHVVTFYKAFSLAPIGRHEIHVCMGTACHVRGAPRVLDRVQDLAGIKPGETSPDMKFSLKTVNCVGCCSLGPVVVVDGEYHGKMGPAKAEDVLNNYE